MPRVVEGVEVRVVQRADVAGHHAVDAVVVSGRDLFVDAVDEEREVMRARPVFGEEIVGDPFAVEGLDQFDLHLATPAEGERHRRLDVAAAIPVRRSDRRERRPLGASDRRGERLHRGVEIVDDERLLEEPRPDPREQRFDPGHARSLERVGTMEACDT